jgi:hypothetical protein
MADFLKKTYAVFDIFQYVLIAGYIFLFLIPLHIPLICYLLLPALGTLGFFLYKDFGESRGFYTAFKIEIIAFMFGIPDYLIKWLGYAINKTIPKPPAVILGMVFLVTGIYLFFSDAKKKDGKIREIHLVKDTGSLGKDRKNTGYDVVLCKNKETGEDVIFEEDARYTHMLCIGPTGCGKTSQVLIPMILQDIQKGHSVIVVEPKGDLAEKVYAMGQKYDNEVLYFNPVNPDCPSFNPLDGKEDEVIETLATIFIMLSSDSTTYFKGITDDLIRRSVMVLKRIEEAHRDPNTGISERPATLMGLSDILHNTEHRGRQLMNDLLCVPTLTSAEEKQNKDTVDWFLNEYYADRSKVYENSSGIRQQVNRLIQNKYLRKVLNPVNGKSDIDFDKILAENKSIAVCTAQGTLRELGSYLGYFLIFSLQSAIFRRPGNEFTRVPSFLYIDEFQKYANSGMSDILTQGRSYRVATVLATQSREQITMGSGREGQAFLEVVTANARSVVAFPGISQADAKFFSLSFGDETKIEERHGETKQKFSFAYGFKDMNYPTQSTQYSEVTEAKFSEADLTYKPFSEITYRIIKDKSVQMAENGVASWIPQDVNAELDRIVDNYNTEQQAKRDAEEMEELEQKRKLYEKFQRGEIGGGKTLGDIGSMSHEKKGIKPENPATAGNRNFTKPTSAPDVGIDDGFTMGNAVGK